MSESEKYLAKIKKLLNLARRSSNPHEAATALNQAQALMHKHKLSQTDIDLMDITSKASKGAPSHAQSIPRYMALLGQLICRAIGVNCYYSFSRNYMNGQKQNTVIFMVLTSGLKSLLMPLTFFLGRWSKPAAPLLALCVRILSQPPKQHALTSSAKDGPKVLIRR